ncbi:MAG: transposase [Candidatus Limnocylindrales bacterium]
MTELTVCPRANEHPSVVSRPGPAIGSAVGIIAWARSLSQSRGSATGAAFHWLLRSHRPAELALLSVVWEAYVAGVPTRRVEALVEALGVASRSESEVSRISAALDAEVEVFRRRSLAGEPYPCLFLNATDVEVRDDGRWSARPLSSRSGWP